MARRPNFLFVITDQQRADHLGCYGNQVLKTPNIDALAARGRRFDKFYVANPICMPNRATIMTGRMPTLHGVRHNGIALSQEHTTFVELLQAAGYDTALIGKSHLQNFTHQEPVFKPAIEPGRAAPPPALADAFKHRRDGPDYVSERPADWLAEPLHQVKLPFYGFDHVELCTWHGDFVEGHYQRWLKAKDPKLLDLWGKEKSHKDPRYSAPQARKPALPAELYPTQYVAERTIAYIEEHKRRAPDRPFFVQCSFPDPHHPFTPPGKYWDMYRPEDMKVSPSFHHPSHDQTPILARLHEIFRSGKADREWVGAYAVTEREGQEIIALTYGMIAFIDDAVGQIVAALRRLGLAEDTIVVFTSDHGDWMTDHGIVQKGAMHYQGLIRVPFIWTDPQAPRPGAAASQLAGTVDIARSILDRAGLSGFHGMQGQKLTGIVAEDAASEHDGMIVEQTTQRPWAGYARPFRVRSFVDARWRITYWSDVEWGELYDLANDPHEVVNLWNEPSARAKKAELAERMLVKTIALQDWAPIQTHEA